MIFIPVTQEAPREERRKPVCETVPVCYAMHPPPGCAHPHSGVLQGGPPQTESLESGCAERTPLRYGEPCLAGAAREHIFQERMRQKNRPP